MNLRKKLAIAETKAEMHANIAKAYSKFKNPAVNVVVLSIIAESVAEMRKIVLAGPNYDKGLTYSKVWTL